MTFGQFVSLAEKNLRVNKRAELRRGQAYFNVLNDVDPELADRIRSGSRDPFYDDDNLGAFLGFVAEHGNWTDE